MGEEGTTKGGSITPSAIGMEDEFVGASYADRCEELCLRMLDRDLYDGAAFLISNEESGLDGEFRTPHERLEFSWETPARDKQLY